MKSAVTEFISLMTRQELIDEPSNNEYKCFDTGGVETAVGDFLYGLVRMLRPEKILETGTYSLISAAYMGLALQDNEKGHLDTVEWEKEHVDRSQIRLEELGLQKYITIHHDSSTTIGPPVPIYDMLFLDTEPRLRFSELVRFYPNLKEGGYALIHDLPANLCQGNVNPDHPDHKSWPFGDLPQQIKNWIKEDRLRLVSFPTPRGLVMFYKTKEGDYRV